MMACAGLCACSSDDIDLGSTSTQKVFDTDVAYVWVNLNDVGTGSTRATYEASTTLGEHTVANAHFYFYDADGNYITKGEIVDNNHWAGPNSGSTNNVERYNDQMVILEGLTGVSYPKYVMTVLNHPDYFDSDYHIEDMMKITTTDENVYMGTTTDVFCEDTTYYGITDANGNFVMTTSSYSGQDDSGNNFCGVTELTDDNFSTSSTDPAEPLNIYVERLAAKVTVNLGTGMDAVQHIDHVTFGNVENNDGMSADEIYDEVYIKFTGWILNGIANQSYMFKNLDESWYTTDPWTGWNSTEDSRSYWAKSCYYTTGSISKNGDGSYSDLHYYNLAKAKDFATYDYCAENTNSQGATDCVINNVNSPALTSVVVKAQCVTADGNTNVTLLNYKGFYYEESNFYSQLSYDYGIYTSAEKAVLTKDNFTMTRDATTGVITVKLSDMSSLYNEAGTSLTAKDAAYATAESWNTTGLVLNSYFDKGYMYYNVPIKHLNTNASSLTDGVYGVVRNHHYIITINSVSNLGEPVYDETDTVIPDDNAPVETSLLTTTVKILSWNEVEQSEDL